ncbi:hypothetical protein ACFE04_025339 [Oxalis oulophora]
MNAIRPFPPPVDNNLESWLTGDIIEVFHHYSWKTATLMKQIDDNYFSVRLPGTSSVFEEDRSHNRTPQAWDKVRGQWFFRRFWDFDLIKTSQDTCSIDDIGAPTPTSYCESSSVGSCNYINGSKKRSYTDQDYCNDTESSSLGRREYKKGAAKRAKLSQHSSELNKYCGVLEELYAAGSLRWEHELQIMNLR